MSRANLEREDILRPKLPLAKRGPLSDEQLEQFDEDGYVVVRQLVPPSLLARARSQREHFAGLEDALYDKIRFSFMQENDVIAELALRSPVAQAVAQLTPAPENGEIGPRALRALKDAAFVLSGTNLGCDFHADDAAFWPAPALTPGPGVNAWIALDRVGEDGGGLAVARGSHTEEFLDCCEAIEPLTCSIAKMAPELKQRLEDIAVAPTLEAGDVILHTRYCFHRGDPFKKDSPAAAAGIARYSCRYMPGHGQVQPGRWEVDHFEIGTPELLAQADPKLYPAAEFDSSF